MVIKLRPEAVAKGFFYLDHTPTGKVFTGTSANMSDAIKEITSQLNGKRCACKALQHLSDKEPEFKAVCQPFTSIGDARKAEKEFRAKKASFLLIN